MLRRYRIPLLLALVALTAIVGIRIRDATSGTYRTQQQLRQVPEEHLFYPGSVDLGQFGSDLERDILGQRRRASAGHVLGTNATEEEIFTFYRDRLSAQGWRESGAEARGGTAQSRVTAYRKGTLLLQIAILRKGDIRNGSAIDAYQTPYQITLYADMPK